MIYVPKILKFSVKLGTTVIFKMVVRGGRKLDSTVLYSLLSFKGGKIFTWWNNLLATKPRILTLGYIVHHLQSFKNTST